MARSDEGEFELVLGNRQLLSGFFIVVILFGVFFTMGYIVGRHSSPAPLNSASAAAPAPESAPAASPAPLPPGQAEVMPAEQKTVAPAPVETPQPATMTRPATAPAESPRPAEPQSQAETHAASAETAEPAPGSYLQVAAPRRTAAGAVVDSLKNKGIVAVLAPGPNEDTVRVLVGPLDSSSVGKMKADLESAGFKPFPKRY